MRTFEIDDVVEYRPWETCSLSDRQDGGVILEVLPDGYYKVQFGRRSIYGTRTGNYHWSKLFN